MKKRLPSYKNKTRVKKHDIKKGLIHPVGRGTDIVFEVIQVCQGDFDKKNIYFYLNHF